MSWSALRLVFLSSALTVAIAVFSVTSFEKPDQAARRFQLRSEYVTVAVFRDVERYLIDHDGKWPASWEDLAGGNRSKFTRVTFKRQLFPYGGPEWYTSANTNAIIHIERISKPSRRTYRNARSVEPVYNGMGTAIMSTSQGVMTDKAAREKNIGGEVLCTVW